MWQLDGSNARLETSQLSCQLDLATPASGLTHLMIPSASRQETQLDDTAIMQLTLADQRPQLEDAYVRGTDLVATFAESEKHPCRVQAYWRFESEGDYFGIQLIVSIQTSRLGATPEFSVSSHFHDQVTVVKDGISIVALPASDLCYVELTDPCNVSRATVDRDTITNELFHDSLEKGVIQRARILGCFLPASTVQQAARNLYERFANSALPLTT
jgi:hypothetical protein